MNFRYLLFVGLWVGMDTYASQQFSKNYVYQFQVDRHQETPRGLSIAETREFWHRTQGSDNFPLLWALRMKSFTSSKPGSGLIEDLKEKFGFVDDPYLQNSSSPLKWVGSTAVWTDEHPLAQDVDLESKEIFSRTKHGKRQITMMGINCAFCHSAEIEVSGVKKVVDGAPNLVDIFHYFKDINISTIVTMVNPKELSIFLQKFDYSAQEAHRISENFSANLLVDLGLQKNNAVLKHIISGLIKAAKRIAPQRVEKMEQAKFMRALHKRPHVVRSYLYRLLDLTYRFGGVDKIPLDAKARVARVARILSADPMLAMTTPGHGRVDAFGNIRNNIVTAQYPVDRTSVVSVPPIWAIKYKALFHYNGNTNSILARNIGQGLGLGTVLYDESIAPTSFDSTVNLYSLARLEELIHKIPVASPESFPVVPKSKKILQQGCDIYARTCAQCHERVQFVGPSQQLMNPLMVPHRVIKTDPWYAEVQATPIGEASFADTIVSLVNEVRDSFVKKYQISEDLLSKWEYRALRGDEVTFRDSHRGESRHSGYNSYLNLAAQDAGYLANHLAGAWLTPPYLHNGSVPSLRDLLRPEASRPKRFLLASKKYDFKNLGYSQALDDYLTSISQLEQEYARSLGAHRQTGTLKWLQLIREKNPKRYNEILLDYICRTRPNHCVDVSLKGNSNLGHEFGVQLSEEEKDALISFLPFVQPPSEYAWKNQLYELEVKNENVSCTIK